MNYLDVIVIICLLYGTVKGFSNGIITEISNIISVFLAIYIAIHFSEEIYPYLNLEALKDYSNVIPLIAFSLVFIIIIIIVKSIGELVNKITNQLALGLISRLLGAVFGMIKLLIICVFLFVFANDYEIIDKKTKANAVFFAPMQKISNAIIPAINKHKKTIIDATKEETEKAKKKLEKKFKSK